MRKANEDVSRLPAWAQSRIKVLEANLELYKKQLAQLDVNNANIHWTFGIGEDHGIPDDCSVYFKMKSCEIHVRVEGDHIRVSTDGPSITVQPWAANTIHVIPER